MTSPAVHVICSITIPHNAPPKLATLSKELVRLSQSETNHFKEILAEQMEMGMVLNWLKEATDMSTGLHTLTNNSRKDGPEALRLVVTLTVSDESKFLEYAQEMATASRLETGCLDYTFAKVDESEDNEYLFVELWTSQETLSAHNLSPHYIRFFPLILNVVTITQVIKALVPTC